MLSDARASASLAPERADAARNRQKILTALREMLKTRSMRDICMDELAQKAEVGKGTLYRRFADRSALCLAVLDEDERELQAQVLAGFGLERSAPPRDKLLVLFRALFDFAFDHADMLEEAFTSMREPLARFRGAPYDWRRRLVARRLSDLALSTSTDTTADALLSLVDPGFLLFHVGNGKTKSALLEEVERILTKIVA